MRNRSLWSVHVVGFGAFVVEEKTKDAAKAKFRRNWPQHNHRKIWAHNKPQLILWSVK